VLSFFKTLFFCCLLSIFVDALEFAWLFCKMKKMPITLYQTCWRNQMLVGPLVIDARLGREDHNSIPHNCIWKETKTTWCQNSPRTLDY
jgi:hypothetical protein